MCAQFHYIQWERDPIYFCDYFFFFFFCTFVMGKIQQEVFKCHCDALLQNAPDSQLIPHKTLNRLFTIKPCSPLCTGNMSDCYPLPLMGSSMSHYQHVLVLLFEWHHCPQMDPLLMNAFATTPFLQSTVTFMLTENILFYFQVFVVKICKHWQVMGFHWENILSVFNATW